MNFVNEVDRIAEAHEGTAGINVVFPSINLIVTFQCEIKFSVSRFEQETVWFKVDTINIGNV